MNEWLFELYIREPQGKAKCFKSTLSMSSEKGYSIGTLTPYEDIHLRVSDQLSKQEPRIVLSVVFTQRGSHCSDTPLILCAAVIV